jgi:hypothetical protein
MMTRRGAGTAAAGRVDSLAVEESVGGAAALTTVTSAGAATGSALTGTGGVSAAASGASWVTGFTGADTGKVVGRLSVDEGPDVVWAGGRAITGPLGGLAAIAGTEGGGATTIRGSWRGCGTILRGTVEAGDSTVGVGLCEVGCAGAGFAATGGGGEAGEAAGRGLDAAAAASSLRRNSSRAASPGFETCDQSILGFCPLPAERFCDSALPRLPRCRYARTRSASSLSSELEWVFFSVTPTAVKVSRISRLLTSSSRARSLIRTLLIRPFNAPYPCGLDTHVEPSPMGISALPIIL